MHAVVAIGLALSVAGCDRVFGLEERDVVAVDAPVRHVVTGTYLQRYVTNDAMFSPITLERIYEPGTIGFAVMLDDNTQPTVEYAADGTFSFETVTPGQAYRIAVNADGTRLEFQHTSPQLALASLVAGRPIRQPVIAATNIQVPFPVVATATSPAHISSTGIFTLSNTGQYGPTVNFDWRLASPAGGAGSGLLEASQFDRVYALEFVQDPMVAGNPRYSAIRAASSVSTTQVAGGTVMLPAPATVTRSACAKIVAMNGDEHQRIRAALPRTYMDTVGAGDWYVFMTPAPDQVGMTGALFVALTAAHSARNLSMSPTFHDPYVGMTMVIEAAASAGFTVQLPGTTTALQLSNITRTYKVGERGTAASCNPTPTTIAPTVGIAGAFTLDGTPLTTDGAVVELDLSRDPRIGWSLVAPGPVDWYSVSLYELVAVTGATKNIVRASELVAGQSVALLDPSFLVPGHTYIISVSATHGGRPEAATGDFATIALPQEVVTSWSYYFEVKAKPAVRQ